MSAAGANDIRRVDLSWSAGQAFSAKSRSGHTIVLDGDVDAGQSPMEALLSALGGCMAIDVVHILEKMRVQLTGLKLEVEGVRRSSEPRSFRRIALRFHLTGDIATDKAERAVQLSLDKYCSVFHSLSPEIEIETGIEIDPG